MAGTDTHSFTGPFDSEAAEPPDPVQLTYRAFDREWVIPDSRLMNRESPPLWAARIEDQVFVIEQSAHPIEGGPGLLFSSLIPDMDAFNNRGGRTLPLLHPDGSPNLAPGLLGALGSLLALEEAPSAHDVAAYAAGVTAHPGFTGTFEDELGTPGIRIPITTVAAIWKDAVALGREIVWLQTFGTACTDEAAGRPNGSVRYLPGDERQPQAHKPVKSMPEAIDYDEKAQVLSVGTGSWAPVRREVWEYEVGGRRVLESWFNYRKATPGGRRTARTSPLADIHTMQWPTAWTIELIDVLTVLTRLVDLEEDQANLLDTVMDSPLLTRGDLAAAGVEWPMSRADRRPRLPLETEGGLDFGEEVAG